MTEAKYSTPLGDKLWRWLVISLPYWWLAIFFLAPFAIVFKISFADPVIAQPPFSNFFDFSLGADSWLLATLDNYRFITEDNLYWISYFKSLKIAAISTVLCLLLGYPMAYGIAKCQPKTRNILLMLVILPFWTSFLLRVYAWIVMLGKTGAINSLLLKMGLIASPLEMLYTDGAVYLGISTPISHLWFCRSTAYWKKWIPIFRMPRPIWELDAGRCFSISHYPCPCPG